MTSFETQAMLGTTLSPLVAVDKGDVTNRVQCAASQTGNALQQLAADTVVIGGAVAAGKAASKYKGFAKFLAKPVTKISNFLKIAGLKLQVTSALKLKSNGGIKSKIANAIGSAASSVGKALGKLSTKGKAIALIGTIAAAALSYIGQKATYKAGQIDQKYTDKAAIMRSGRKFV